jgi:uncharacterized protein YgfB (UPF0149 family)
MQVQSKIPAFDDVSHLLMQSNSLTTPSKMHGMLCGFICMGARLNGNFLLDNLLKRLAVFSKSTTEQQALILCLYDAASRQLSGQADDFSLLLPTNTVTLTEQAEALSQWCQGFMYSLDFVTQSFDEIISEEVDEALRCMRKLAKLDFAKIEVNEEDHSAYSNVFSYVENSVVMIYDELANEWPENINYLQFSHYLH